MYSKRTHLQVVVTSGPEKNWMGEAAQDADLIFGGAEYMLTEFGMQHPGFLAAGSRQELYPRAFGIVVRRDNPKRIRGLRDLARPGVKLLDMNAAGQLGAWEDLAGRRGLIPGIEGNIALSVETSAEATEAWKTRPDLDAWMTYVSWGRRLGDDAKVVQLPIEERIYRGTPIAVAARTTQRALAEGFVKFLKSPQAHAVFVRWGWD